MPRCERVTALALLAEAHVTPILMDLARSESLTLHGLDFRVKSSLSMTRKVVAQLHAEDRTHDDEVAAPARSHPPPQCISFRSAVSRGGVWGA